MQQAKRARQIRAESGLPNGRHIKEGEKPLSIAIDEFSNNEVKIVNEDDTLEE